LCTLPVSTVGYVTTSCLASSGGTAIEASSCALTCASGYASISTPTVTCGSPSAGEKSGTFTIANPCEANARLFVFESESPQKEQAATYNMPLVLLACVFTASSLIGVALYIRRTRSSPQVAELLATEEDDDLE